MGLRRRRRDGGQRPQEPGVADDCVAFLSGHYVDRLLASGDPIPVWAWLNPLAHYGLGEFLELARRRLPGDGESVESWSEAVFHLAGEILRITGEDGAALARLQREVLVPLELDLAAGSRDDLRPAGLVRLVLGVLA